MKKGHNKVKRRAGILMHISSLPGKYGIGDFGPEAYKFADFLSRTGQCYWQILPLNQIYKEGGFSPYSSLSAFAGNILFISPELLFKQKLIDSIPKSIVSKKEDKVNFEDAGKMKEDMLDIAYKNFKKGHSSINIKQFNEFKNRESYWLNDYAHFITLKKKYNFISWKNWPGKIRDRQKDALIKFTKENIDNIEREKFAQFIFSLQWKKLKNHCKKKGISIFGDIPIYINYESADVWSNPGYFKLNGNKDILWVAGVPPDYFSEKGQLWGMPVFRWDVMKKEGFSWWIKRIKRNLELFDLVRLDHFRGFYNFWEVPAKEETAINGRWTKAAGIELFNKINKIFPKLPFVAEDLGDVDKEVYNLRDKFGLPGMRILQFAFGKKSSKSIHSLHNHTYNSVVYTGTHDNNTCKGWFKDETSKLERQNLKKYLRKKINQRNINDEMIRLAYMSAAKIAIIPIQDFIGLGSKARINIPSVTEGNWTWRLTKKQLSNQIEKRMRELVLFYGRK